MLESMLLLTGLAVLPALAPVDPTEGRGAGPAPGSAQEADAAEEGDGHHSLDIGPGWGLSFGNSPSWSGLRFNAIDSDLRRINGVNITFWKPGWNAPDSQMNGLGLGLYGPGAGELNGLHLGILSTSAVSEMNGIMVSGIATISHGDINGLGLSGLATVAKGDMTGIGLGLLATATEGDMNGLVIGGLATRAGGHMWGINAGLLATLADGDMDGLQLSGLATMSDGDMWGIQLSGLATISKGSMGGINLGGLATLSDGSMWGLNGALLATMSDGNMSGINLGGLATVSGGRMAGLNVGGLAVIGGDQVLGINAALIGVTTRGRHPMDYYGLHEDLVVVHDDDMVHVDEFAVPESKTRIGWLSVAGYKVAADVLEGLNVALITTQSHEMNGVTAGIWNEVTGTQTGLSLGIYNEAEDLAGVQIGLLNHVASNPPWARWLPIVNARF